jgi:hypothetical protein
MHKVLGLFSSTEKRRKEGRREGGRERKRE